MKAKKTDDEMSIDLCHVAEDMCDIVIADPLRAKMIYDNHEPLVEALYQIIDMAIEGDTVGIEIKAKHILAQCNQDRKES